MTLYDLRAWIVKIVDIFRKPPKLYKVDISFVDQAADDSQHRVWADVDGELRHSFQCEAEAEDLELLLEPFIALRNVEAVNIELIRNLSDDMISVSTVE